MTQICVGLPISLFADKVLPVFFHNTGFIDHDMLLLLSNLSMTLLNIYFAMVTKIEMLTDN